MTMKLQRFDFGALRDFRGPIVAATAAKIEEAPPPPPPPPTFSEADLEAAKVEAKKAGYQEGFAAGEAEAKARQDAQTQYCEQAIIALEHRLADLDKRYAATLQEQSREVSELAMLIARKVAGDALNEHGVEAIKSLVTSCLPVILPKPKTTIELHPETLPKAEARLHEFLSAQRYTGEVVYHANPALGVNDARIDWGEGNAQRSTQAMWQEIESLLKTVPTTVTLAQPPVGDNHG